MPWEWAWQGVGRLGALSAVQVPGLGLGAGRGGWEGGFVGVKVWFLGFFGWFLWERPVFCLFLLVWWEVVGFFCRHHVVLVILGGGSGNTWKLWLELCVSIGLDAGYNWYVLPRWALDVGRPDMAMRLALACSSQDGKLT